MMRAHHVGALALLVIALTLLATSAQSKVAGTSRNWLKADSQRQTDSSSLSSRTGIGKSIAGILLLGVCGYAAWRKARKVRVSTTPARTHIRVVGGTLVGPKARAVVAEVGGRLILLGVTERSVRKLAWLDASDDVVSESEQERKTRTNAAGSNDAPAVRIPDPDRYTFAQRRHDVQRSKFSEVLRDAVGIKSRPFVDPALVLAESTRDCINLTAPKDQSVERLSAY